MIRLIIAEGPRFPRIAEFYYRNVVAHIMPLLAKLAERAVGRGEFSSDAYARYLQLIAAPLLLAVVWDSLFASAFTVLRRWCRQAKARHSQRESGILRPSKFNTEAHD